jgi:hypothetical protein
MSAACPTGAVGPREVAQAHQAVDEGGRDVDQPPVRRERPDLLDVDLLVDVDHPRAVVDAESGAAASRVVDAPGFEDRHLEVGLGLNRQGAEAPEPRLVAEIGDDEIGEQADLVALALEVDHGGEVGVVDEVGEVDFAGDNLPVIDRGIDGDVARPAVERGRPAPVAGG